MFLTQLPGSTNYAQRGNPDIPSPLHAEGRPAAAPGGPQLRTFEITEQRAE